MQIPADVYVQIETIRRSGEINMLDRRGVQFIAHRRNFYAAVCWLEDNRTAYGRGFFEGFEPDRALTGDEQDAIDSAGQFANDDDEWGEDTAQQELLRGPR
jgi:hypothetical protein